MFLTVHCSIPTAYAPFVKYKRAVQTHPIVMKFYRTTSLYVQYISEKFRSQRITHDLLKIIQDNVLKSVLTEFHATWKLNHYFYIHPNSVRPLP